MTFSLPANILLLQSFLPFGLTAHGHRTDVIDWSVVCICYPVTSPYLRQCISYTHNLLRMMLLEHMHIVCS